MTNAAWTTWSLFHFRMPFCLIEALNIFIRPVSTAYETIKPERRENAILDQPADTDGRTPLHNYSNERQITLFTTAQTHFSFFSPSLIFYSTQHILKSDKKKVNKNPLSLLRHRCNTLNVSLLFTLENKGI